jgi:hypothetical protein
MAKHVYKKTYGFDNPEKYRVFLKRHLIKLSPRYYSVASWRRVETVDGPMYALKIIMDAVDNPNLEVIAEAWINDEYIYLWRDHCWAIAVDKDNRSVLKEEHTADEELCIAAFGGQLIGGCGTVNVAPFPCNKIMVVHRIGNETI